MQSDNGREIEKILEIEGIARSYFQQLFSAGRRGNYDNILAGINSCIFDKNNLKLKARYTKEEIREALAGLGLTKALGEDGFLTLFYQKCWPIIGEEVTSFCLNLLNGGMDISPINKNNIVLIPKIPNLLNITHFRLISLCSVLYKLLAKVISNCFRLVMNKCIDLSQSVFVPGRLICDNVLLAYEILHTLKNKRIGKKGFMAVKLHMSKAYDRVEWSFVEKIMKKLGFNSECVDMLMKCVTTMSYSVVFNGVIGENYCPF